MGYCMSQQESKFSARVENVGRILAIVRKYDLRWEFEYDETGNIVGIQYEGEKLNEDESMFIEMNPYVTPGSYIQMLGDEGDIWRWIFGPKFEEKHAKLSW